MKILNKPIVIAWFGVFLGACVLSRLVMPDEATERDRAPLPRAPELPGDARPELISLSSLPGSNFCAKPTIAVDRNHQALAVAMDLSGGGLELIRWGSIDGGNTWGTPAPVPKWPDDYAAMGDPWLLTDHRGRFHLTNVAAFRRNRSRATMPVVFRRSIDDGSSWQPPVMIAEIGDRPMLAVSPDGMKLVIVCAQVDPASQPTQSLRSPDELPAVRAATRNLAGVFRSDDRGRTWKTLSGPRGISHGIPFGVACDDQGRIACCWIDAEGDRSETSRSLVCTTVDGGRAWETTTLVERLQPDRVHAYNGGRFPVLTLDNGGGLHVAYVAAGGKGLLVRSSRDWRSWEAAVPLSSEACDEVRFPGIAAGSGLVHVTWMERRDGRYRMWYRGSKDQGASWSAPLLISRRSTTVSLEDDGFDIVSEDDQTCVADDGAGVAHAVWAAREATTEKRGEIRHATIQWRSPGSSTP